MRNIKLVLEYDGTKFFGFQRQPAQLTVQQVVEESLSKLFNVSTKIKSASGRTDSGVHAEHQVVNFYTPSVLKLAQIQKGMNRYLPSHVSVVQIEEMPKDFHARFHAKLKVYEYRIWNSVARSPLKAAYTYHVIKPLNVTKMRKAAKLLLGRHDFKSFTAAGAGREKETVRKLSRFEIKKQGAMISIRVEGNGFLQHMVRNLVGTLIDVGKGKVEIEDVTVILKAKDRRQAGATAPAKGLFLTNVTY